MRVGGTRNGSIGPTTIARLDRSAGTMSSSSLSSRRVPGLLALMAIGLIVTACGTGAAAPALNPVAGPVGGGAPGDQAQPQPQAVSNDDSTANLYDINLANLLIIKTGTLDLQVAGLDDALATASQKITALGGYASGSQRSGGADGTEAQVTYRFPAARWDDVLVALRSLSIKVLGEQSQSQDVTGQVVDLGARITNLEATELALQGIMTKADKIADVLAVQAQLTDVRGQIEELTAQRKHLQEQAAFSTLVVNYSLKEQAVVETSKKFDPASEVDRASASLVDVLQTVATAGIWFGIVWLPILIVLGILGAIGLFVARRFSRSRPGGPSGPDSGWRGPGTVVAPAAPAPSTTAGES
jgi:hypothetical protein